MRGKVLGIPGRKGNSAAEGASESSKQIQRIIQIDFLPDAKLVFRLVHVIEQKFQNQRAAKARPSILKWEKPMGR